MISFFKKNKLSLLILTIFGSIYGIASVISIPKEAMPSVNLAYYAVSVIYPGADPSTVEQQAVNKLEQKLKSISLVKEISSTCAYNYGLIMIEFYKGKDDVSAMNDLKGVIDQIYPSLPSDVKYPTLKKLEINDTPIYTFSVAGPYGSETLYSQVKDLEESIKTIPGVGEIMIVGKPTKEIKMMFDLEKLALYELDVNMVINQLRGSFLKIPADKKQVGEKLYSFEVINYAENLTGLLDQIKSYDVINIGGKTIKVKDIADVYYSSKKSDKKSFVVNDLDQQITTNAIAFQVSKVPGFDIQELTSNLKNEIQKFAEKNPKLMFVETTSQEDIIKKVYNLFIENFVETGLLVFIIILFFLGFRSSFVILISFIVVYLINFIYLKNIDYTFNNIVSFSLILVLGIMVDNLIVISQGIVIGLRKYENNIRHAIKDSLKNYSRAIIFGTSTTIAIFLPLYFGLSGAMGEFMKSMPVTIISNLVISLLITLIVLPVLSIYFYKRGIEFKTTSSLELLEKIGHKFASLFYHINKKRIGALLLVLSFIGFFVFSIGLIVKGVVKIDFMGNTDSDNVWINIKYNPGITLEENQKNTYQISKEVLKYLQENFAKEIKYIAIDIGTAKGESSTSQSMGGGNSNLAAFTLRLVPGEEREVKSYVMVETLQTYLTSIKNKYPFIVDVYPFTSKSGPSGGKPVGFYLVGDDYVQINNYLQEIMPELKTIPGVYNIGTSIEYTNGRITYMLDENKLKEYGLSNMSVALSFLMLKNSSYQPNGIKIKEFNEFGDEPISLNAFVEYDEKIDTMKIGKVTLDQVVKTKELGPELVSITKLDGDKVVVIEADKKNEVALSDITIKIDEIIQNHPLPKGVTYKSGADIQAQSDSARELGTAMIVGILLMLLVLIFQFNNVKYAVVIITSVFLTIGGSICILAIFGQNFSFVAQLGIFGVLGVGVNQALIHIEDFKEFYEKKGFSVRESFRMSIAERFVPIFLTKLVTIVGLVILATKDEMFGGLALAFIGGLVVSFFITLLYIPSLMRLITKDYYDKDKRKDEDRKHRDDVVFHPEKELAETMSA